ncbi:MAG TPA: ASCH domain-containing protein [Jiangellaceae bacterium]|nr:ASCH domain-containing protein [Jiangellaceae bacterium]
MWPRVDDLRTLCLGTPGEMRAELNSLVLDSAKTATAGLLAEYETEGEELERVGEYLALVDDHDAPVGVVEVTAVSVVPFGQVPWEFADAEGEGYTSIEHWRDSHARFWAGQGAAVDDDTDVVCIHFVLTSGRA